MRLPTKASKLIRLALKDLAKVEKSKKYKIHMYSWHEPQKTGKCEVCLAGAVMAKTLKVNVNEKFDPHFDFTNRQQKIFFALNSLREGRVFEALDKLGETRSTAALWPEDRVMPEYGKKGTRFKKEMLKLADELKKAGY